MSNFSADDWGLGGRCAYEILGVRGDATAVEIKQAYRKVVREIHPDVRGGRDLAADELFHLTTAAYRALTERRADYDAFRADPSADEDGSLDIDDPWDEAQIVQDDPWEWADDGHGAQPLLSGEMATVIFRRPWRYVEAARAYTVKIDGVPIGRLPAGRRLTVTVLPGPHIAEASLGLNQELTSNFPIEFVAYPGQDVRIRVIRRNLQEMISQPFARGRPLRLIDG